MKAALKSSSLVGTSCNSVEQKFSNSSQSYLKAAHLQRRVGQALLNLMSDQRFDIGIDLGCGPGTFTSYLKEKTKSLLSMDLSTSMLIENSQAQTKIRTNSEALPLRENSVSVCFSSLMVQWCDLNKVLHEIHRVLEPNGHAYVSTLVSGTLAEYANAWSKVDNDHHIHTYLNMEQAIKSANILPWSAAEIEQKDEVLWYDNVSLLAKELKQLGANFVAGKQSRGLVTPNKWKRMENEYHRSSYCKAQNAYPATYKVLYLKLIK